MRRLLTILALAAATAGAADSDLPNYLVESDIQKPNEQFVIDRRWLGNNPLIEWRCWNGVTNAFDLSGWSLTLFYAREQYSTAGVHIAASTVSSNRAYFVGATNFLNLAWGDYWVTIRGSKSGIKNTFGTGRLVVDYDPFETAGGVSPTPTATWDWDAIGTYEGTWPIYGGTNALIEVTATGVVIHASVPGGLVTNGQWNAQVNALSNYAGQAFTTGSLAYALAAAAATGAPVYAESDPLWGAVSNATAQRISSNAAGVVAVGLVASNAVSLSDSRGFTNSGGVKFAGPVNAEIAVGTTIENDTVVRMWRGGQGELDFIVETNASEGVGILFENSQEVWLLWATGEQFRVQGGGGGQIYFDNPIYGNALGLTNLPIYIASGGSIAQTATGVVITITGGSGAPQSPLTNNVNAAGYSITNGLFSGDGSGLTNLPAQAAAEPQSYSVEFTWRSLRTLATAGTYVQFAPTNAPGSFTVSIVTNYNNIWNTNTWTYAPGTSGTFCVSMAFNDGSASVNETVNHVRRDGGYMWNTNGLSFQLNQATHPDILDGGGIMMLFYAPTATNTFQIWGTGPDAVSSRWFDGWLRIHRVGP